MNLLPVLAQAADPATVREAAQTWAQFWDKNGAAAAILAVIVGLGLVHYWFVVLPREKGKTEDQRSESKARTESHQKIGSATEKIADCIVRYDARFDSLDTAVGHVHRRIDSICRGGRPDADPNGPGNGNGRTPPA